MNIAILLFDNYTALDVVGPYEVLNKIPNSKILFVGKEKKEYKDSFGLSMRTEYSIDEITQADVLLIPGGFGTSVLLSDQSILNWIKETDHTTQWTTSVCSGALLLAEAEILNNKNCTTHWSKN